MVTIVTVTIVVVSTVDFAGQAVARAVNLRPEEDTMIRQIKFVGVPVRDQDRALAFYRDKLGFKVGTDQPFDGNQRWIEMRIPGAETGVVLFTPKGQED